MLDTDFFYFFVKIMFLCLLRVFCYDLKMIIYIYERFVRYIARLRYSAFLFLYDRQHLGRQIFHSRER